MEGSRRPLLRDADRIGATGGRAGADRVYAEAWKQLTDPQGFYAPYGPTTAEQRHPGFRIAYEGDDCQWNGPSWPYTRSHRLKLAGGREITWIDESLNPFTGEWRARARKVAKGTFYGRGDYYNHSGYCDLVIGRLMGLRPRADGAVDVRPLVPEGKWDWFCVDQVPYHGRTLTILWDRTGSKFGRGKGLRVLG